MTRCFPFHLPVWLAALALAACATQQPGTAFNDPYEAMNRRFHEGNKRTDRAILRPAGQFAAALPDELTGRVSNFADNLALPGMVLNGLLQADIGGAATNTLRLLINSTVGIGGLFDPADTIGLLEETTDFGETLAVWGAPEGAYLELPILGPSTQRDAFGAVVDLLIDPLAIWGTQEQLYYATGSSVAARIIDRGRFASTIDSILYDSADSYAQSRLIYIENRRFELGEAAGTFFDDPYAEFGGDTYIDPYSSPNVDPYEALE